MTRTNSFRTPRQQHGSEQYLLERSARAEIEQSAERMLTEAEWTAMSRRLVDFVKILRDWDQPSQRGNNN